MKISLPVPVAARSKS